MPSKAIKYNFGKTEKLCSKNAIDELFSKGKSLHYNNFKVIFLLNHEVESFEFKVLISVPKKHIKLAVGRNKIKRRIRESIRLHKNDLIEDLQKRKISCKLAIIYTTSTEVSQSDTHSAIKYFLNRLITKNEENFK